MREWNGRVSKAACHESTKPFTVDFYFFTESLRKHSSGSHSKIEKDCKYSQKFLICMRKKNKKKNSGLGYSRLTFAYKVDFI